MSYILEALKKSQEERELGRVPTLASGPYPNAGKASRTSPWTLAAVALAALAVLIALYAALGTRRADLDAVLGRAAVVAPDAAGKVPSEPKPAAEAAPEAIQERAKAEPAGLAVSKPPPGKTAEVVDGGGMAPGAVAEQPSVLDTDELLDQVNRYEEEGGFARDASGERQPGPPSAFAPGSGPGMASDTPPVPPDLRREILNFKEKALREGAKRSRPAPQSGVRDTQAPAPTKPEKAPPTRLGGVEPAASDVAHLRLPPEVTSNLPPTRLTVHVYSEDPAKRFVVINSLRTQEGERMESGVVIEEIRPDGVILSFEGHRFFRAR